MINPQNTQGTHGYTLSSCSVVPQPNNYSSKVIFSVPNLHTSATQELSESNQDSEFSAPVAPKLKILPMRTRKTPKFTLVLDLDETLVHSQLVPVSNPDNIFQVKLNESLYNIYVCYRPGLANFLNSVCSIFEVVIFTASMKLYADHVLKSLDPCQKLKYKFYREFCTEHNGNYIKDLRILGRDLSRVIIIDNSEVSFSFQPENGILIKSWFSDQSDCELDSIHRFLLKIQDQDDVRPLLQKTYCQLSSNIN